MAHPPQRQISPMQPSPNLNFNSGFAAKLSLSLIGLAMLSACSVFPQYMQPDIKTPTTWQASLPHAGKVETLVNWWSQFNDPVLMQLLNTAEQDNPSLDIAIANIKAARANVTIARADGLPSVNANASATRSKSISFATATGINDTKKASLDASWEIDLFGAVKFSKQAAQARLQAKESDWHEARVSLAAEVSNNYLDYRTCQLLVKSYQQQLLSKNETARLTNINAQAGFAAPADAALAAASASSTQSTLIAQQAQCDSTLKALVALTGMRETTLRAKLGEGEAKIPMPAAFAIERLPAEVVKQRPDLISYERALAAASADIGTAEANRYPSISLTGSIGVTNTSLGSFSGSGNTWSFGPSLSIPVFNAGKLKAQVSSAEANYAAALATYQQNVRTAIKEVEQNLVSLDSATRRAQAEQVSTEQYRSYLKATEINWRAGGVSLLSLEDARRQAINAEVTLINQQHDRVQYWIALYKSLGGGWPVSAEKTKSGEK
jgi:outer membrane protein, multidrug efflux system